MTTATLRLPSSIADAPTAPKKGLLARIYAALIEARMRHAMQEIARYRHLVPDDVVKNTGYGANYEATLTNDGALPFTR